jgi:hypothetical protein
MGQAEGNRRALVAMVKDCIGQVNAMTTLATEVREAHNTLAKQTGADVASLKARLDTLSAWCKRLEEAAAVEARRHTLTRSELAQMTIERDAFIGLTFLGRLRWIFTGGWTKPSTYAEVTNKSLEIVPEKRTETHDSSRLRGYIPHTSRGPAVLP